MGAQQLRGNNVILCTEQANNLYSSTVGACSLGVSKNVFINYVDLSQKEASWDREERTPELSKSHWEKAIMTPTSIRHKNSSIYRHVIINPKGKLQYANTRLAFEWRFTQRCAISNTNSRNKPADPFVLNFMDWHS